MSAFYNVDQPPFNMGSAARAIAAANNGLLFDQSDMSTMFQDAAGTIPVTAVEQPVGKMLDKSGNGYHATQSVTASRPTISARYNLLTKTEDFSDAVWVKSNITLSDVNYVITPYGSIAKQIVEDTSTLTHAMQYANGYITGVPNAVKVTIKAAGRNYAFVSSSTTHVVAINLITGATSIAAGSPTNIKCTYISDGWWDVSFNIPNPTSTVLNIYVSNTEVFANRAYAGDGTSGLFVCNPDIRISGSTINTYQRVNTATDYDTNPAYFPKYLKFDGIDDYLNLPFMNLYGGGAASIIAARNAVSQATDTYIISERSTTNANPKYFPSRQLASAGNIDSYISDDTATVVLDTIGSAFSGAGDKVIRSVVDTGNNIKLFKNGALVANDNYTRAGTLTLNNTTIGASVSTTTSNYASMKLYGLIITKSALTDAQRIKCERFLARKAGVAL